MNSRIDTTQVDPSGPLVGELAAQARTVVGEIAIALREPPVAWIPGPAAEPFRQARGASLSQGRAGLALFYAYLHRSGMKVPGLDASEWAERYLDEACDALARVPVPLGLMHGCAGVLWTVRHLHDLLDSGEPGTLDLATEYLGYPVAKDGFDLWHGLVGHGVYALEGLPDPAAARLVADLVDRLADIALEDDEGARWLTHPTYLKPAARRGRTQPYANLGAAHGQACVIVFLARAHAAGIATDLTLRLTTDAVRWLLARVATGASGIYVPMVHAAGTEPRLGMEAWCNGAPGVAATLMVAADCCAEESWRADAIGLARDAALRAERIPSLPDGSLCHGTAGEALLWHGFYRATGEDLFAAAATTWYGRTMQMQRPGEGVGGFVAKGYDSFGDVVEMHEPGLLQGAAGVGLALMAGLGMTTADWSRVLQITGDDKAVSMKHKEESG